MMRPALSLPLSLSLLGVMLLPACKRPTGGAQTPAGGGPGIVPATGAQVVALVREGSAPVTLVNVWATWCMPCREEMPDILRLYRDYRGRGLRLVLVSADFDDQMPEAKKFLAEHGVDFTTYIKAGNDMGFIDALDPKWTGAIPASFVYGRNGALRDFWEGEATYERFERAVLAALRGGRGDQAQAGGG
jgi:thiol-disulfide isomerase/thioredoxin